MNSKTSFIRIASLVFLAVLIGGCSSTGLNGGLSSQMPVYNGMLSSELLDLLNEPLEIREVDPPRDGFEIWVYQRSMKNVVYSATRTQNTPYVNPLTGEPRDMIEPVYSNESTTLTVETQILIAEGTVVSWKTKRQVERDLD